MFQYCNEILQLQTSIVNNSQTWLIYQSFNRKSVQQYKAYTVHKFVHISKNTTANNNREMQHNESLFVHHHTHVHGFRLTSLFFSRYSRIGRLITVTVGELLHQYFLTSIKRCQSTEQWQCSWLRPALFQHAAIMSQWLFSAELLNTKQTHSAIVVHPHLEHWHTLLFLVPVISQLK